MVLATDIDGTFFGGTSLHKQQLYELLASSTNITIVFVTGHGLEETIPVLTDPFIPGAQFIISDAGATIVDGYSFKPVEPLQQDIENKWPGSSKVRECLKDFVDLKYREVPQQRRCSFFLENETMLKEIESRMNQLGCDIIYSGHKCIDVLPKMVNRGRTLVKLVDHLQVKSGDVMVAAGNMNNLSLFQCGYKAVIVGNADEALVETTKAIKDIYRTQFPGAGGIIMGMEYFGFISRFSKNR